MACRPAPARASATALFWLRQIQRLAQDLVLQCLLAEQPLQFAHLALQRPVFGGRHHFFAVAFPPVNLALLFRPHRCSPLP
jgi:hypothetical protein